MKEEKRRGRINSLRAGLAALFMLSGPLIYVKNLPITFSFWILLFLHLSLNQFVSLRLAGLRGVPALERAIEAGRWTKAYRIRGEKSGGCVLDYRQDYRPGAKR